MPLNIAERIAARALYEERQRLDAETAALVRQVAAREGLNPAAVLGFNHHTGEVICKPQPDPEELRQQVTEGLGTPREETPEGPLETPPDEPRGEG